MVSVNGRLIRLAGSMERIACALSKGKRYEDQHTISLDYVAIFTWVYGDELIQQRVRHCTLAHLDYKEHWSGWVVYQYVSMC